MALMPKSRPRIGETIVRSLMVGLVYALANALVAVILGPMSRLAPSLDNFLVWFLMGTLICLSLSPFILNTNKSRSTTILAVWAVLALVRSIGLGIEGALFKPTAELNALVGAVFGILVSLLVAWLSVHLLMPVDQGSQENARQKRSWWSWAWRVLVVGLAYFAFYFIFGAANFLLYTKVFYENNPEFGLARPEAGIIFLAQLIRGPLFGLGALFIFRIADGLSHRKVAVWLGFLLFVVGGVAPYVEVTYRTMPLGFNLATLTEILFQNFLTGIAATYIYKGKQIRERAT
jgi:hypothetical protein